MLPVPPESKWLKNNSKYFPSKPQNKHMVWQFLGPNKMTPSPHFLCLCWPTVCVDMKFSTYHSHISISYINPICIDCISADTAVKDFLSCVNRVPACLEKHMSQQLLRHKHFIWYKLINIHLDHCASHDLKCNVQCNDVTIIIISVIIIIS